MYMMCVIWYTYLGGEIMAKTRAEIKNAYAKKAYDDIRLQVPKGQKDVIWEHAKNQSETLGGFIKRAIAETMERDNAKDAGV